MIEDGASVDRTKLLSVVLEQNPAWVEMAKSVDAALAESGIDDARVKLQSLRSPINMDDALVRVNSETGILTALSDIERHEKATLVNTAELLGFRFYDQNILSAESYLRLCMSLGQYYSADKGTERFDDFMAFVINDGFTVVNTWTEDYVTFYEEGSGSIGTPVYEGGTWYPTTHVVVRYGLGSLAGVTMEQVYEFFYYFANINLVLHRVDIETTTLNTIGICGASRIYIEY